MDMAKGWQNPLNLPQRLRDHGALIGLSLCALRLCGKNFLSVIGARQVIQGWSGRPNRAIGPATLGPLDRGNTDWIFCRFLFVNINAETGPIIRP
jgi:hypothetical protein